VKTQMDAISYLLLKIFV